MRKKHFNLLYIIPVVLCLFGLILFVYNIYVLFVPYETLSDLSMNLMGGMSLLGIFLIALLLVIEKKVIKL